MDGPMSLSSEHRHCVPMSCNEWLSCRHQATGSRAVPTRLKVSALQGGRAWERRCSADAGGGGVAFATRTRAEEGAYVACLVQVRDAYIHIQDRPLLTVWHASCGCVREGTCECACLANG